jgi:type IV fimbrial biogenesis protein FimT
LQYTKSEAVKRNAVIFFTFQTGSNWCYGSNATTTCNCSVANSCSIGSTQAPNTGLITLTATGLVNNAVQFNPRQGAASAATNITFTNNQGDALTIKIGLLGSITICSSQITGYPAC